MRKGKRAGTVQLGEERAPGRMNSSLPVGKGTLKESHRGLLNNGM